MVTKFQEVNIDVGRTVVKGDLFIPNLGKGLVIFSHGSGSSGWSVSLSGPGNMPD